MNTNLSHNDKRIKGLLKLDITFMKTVLLVVFSNFTPKAVCCVLSAVWEMDAAPFETTNTDAVDGE